MSSSATYRNDDETTETTYSTNSRRSFYDGEISPEEGEDYYTRLINEAPYIPGDKCEIIPAKDIAWCDPDLLQKGIYFNRRNIYSIFMANTAALMFGFAVKPESVVLLRSGKFHEPEKSFLRFLSTGYRIGSWVITGLLNEDSEGIKQLRIVRKLHSLYSKSKVPLPSLEEMGWVPEMTELSRMIRNGLSEVDTTGSPDHLLSWDPPLNLSQFDMALTQFGFFGILYLFPETLGIDPNDGEGMRAYFHFWAVVGRLLGMEDRFNLALHPDPVLFRKIYEKIGIASLKSTDDRVVCLQQALIEGISRRLPVPLTLKGWTYYGFKEQVDGFKGEEFRKSMTWRDKASYYLLKASFVCIRRSVVAKFLLNFMLAILVQLGFWIYLPKNNECIM